MLNDGGCRVRLRAIAAPRSAEWSHKRMTNMLSFSSLLLAVAFLSEAQAADVAKHVHLFKTSARTTLMSLPYHQPKSSPGESPTV